MGFEFLLPVILAMTVFAHVRMSGTGLGSAGPVQYILHWLYAVAEPLILRIVDRLITSTGITGSAPGMALLKNHRGNEPLLSPWRGTHHIRR